MRSFTLLTSIDDALESAGFDFGEAEPIAYDGRRRHGLLT